ncbi:hypothetical protein G5714_000024 [Onychostoma macrolepis]|uniref:Uncharacterized protein n=1 Tax=Onychostoma macrolepis TaxID=369639 RepID=A0A7J6DF63_9TELE|nr:hypothetical protein G5714_000024 [Onychostoma macrolepis]
MADNYDATFDNLVFDEDLEHILEEIFDEAQLTVCEDDNGLNAVIVLLLCYLFDLMLLLLARVALQSPMVCSQTHLGFLRTLGGDYFESRTKVNSKGKCESFEDLKTVINITLRCEVSFSLWRTERAVRDLQLQIPAVCL